MTDLQNRPTSFRPLTKIIARHRPATQLTDGSNTGVSRRTVIQTSATAATALSLASVGLLQFVGAQDASPSGTPSGTATAATSDAAVTSCAALTPELTEGPYYVDEALIRRDIVDDREGLPVALIIKVIDTVECLPLADAAVKIWHCDARGYYSGIAGNDPGSDSSAEEVAAAADSMFLRGIQITDTDGSVTFDTIYPGWYRGRTVHIHMMVRIAGEIDAEETYEGGTTAHTGQLFFEDAVSDAVFLTDAYANRPEDERIENDEDNILGDHGDDPEFLVAMTQLDSDNVTGGFSGIVTVGVDPAAVQSEGGMGGGANGPGGDPPSGGPGDPPAGTDDVDQSASPSASDAA